MGEFPSGEFPGESGGAAGEGQAASTGDEPGFEDSASSSKGGGEALPDMRDEPTLEDSMGAFEDAMGEAAGGSSGESTASAGGQPAGGSPAGGSPAGGTPAGSGTAGAGAYGIPGFPGGSDGSQGSGGGGTMTPAEQVAILDAQLERGTGEFDAMILEEQAEQRRAAREQAARQSPSGGATSASEEGGAEEGGMADAGEYSTGGSMPGGGVGGGIGGGGVPQNTAKYPPPANVPSGSDDDVVARQLREAAMREPDPAVREKLWDEYRKYKGVSS